MTTTSISFRSDLPVNWTRRKIAGLLALAAISLGCPRRILSAEAGSKATAPSGSLPRNDVQYTWAVRSGAREASRVDALRQASAEVAPQRQTFEPPPEEADDYGDPAFAPMILIAGAAALAVIADVIIRLRRDLNGGLIVDARERTINIRENPKIAAGMVIVVGPDKAVAKFEPSTQLDVAGLIKAVAEIG
ncbi:MAG: hypothetical protein EOO23_07175, partial [Comamonadaceae bacterium]